jgi:hypothetical protein
MSHYQPAPEGKDPELWEIAQKRASFKGHLVSYVIVNTFFWAIWYFTRHSNDQEGLPWPIWPMLGWGIGLSFHFMGAYVLPKSNMVENEYRKLKINNNINYNFTARRSCFVKKNKQYEKVISPLL